MKVIERMKAPTPKFFRVLRRIGLALLAISGSAIAAPVALPVAVVTVAGYMAVAGGVISAVSQVTVDSPPSPLKGGQNTGIVYEMENLNKIRDGN
jgi:uncharacterized membrane protein HdeD (DUF308 family)